MDCKKFNLLCRRKCSLFEMNNEKETEGPGDFTLTIRTEISNVTVAYMFFMLLLSCYVSF